MKKLLKTLCVVAVFSGFGSFGQFQMTDTTCLTVDVDIINNSSAVDSVMWDFCHQDMETIGAFSSVKNIPGIRTYLTSTIYDNGVWYQFVSARNTGEIHLLSYGNDLNGIPIEVDTLDNANLGVALNLPRDLILRREGGNWYGLLARLSPATLFRLDFGGSLENIPSVTDLGNLSSWDFLHGLDLVEFNNDIIVIGSSINSDKLTLLNFGNSITNTPTGGDILDIGVSESLIDGPTGVKLFEVDGEWFGFVASNTNGVLVRMSFGVNLFSEPTYSVEQTITKASDVDIVKEGLQMNLFAINESGNITHLRYESDFNSTPVVNSYTNSSLNNNFNIEVVKNSPGWSVFSSSWASRIIYRHQFSNTCDPSTANIPESVEVIPTSLFYSTTGTYVAELTNYLNGEFTVYEDTVFVRDLTPPLISYSIDENRCVDFSNTFSPSGSAGIITYQWNFGDGSPISNDESPTHQYASSGTYTVRVDVNDGFCDNFYEEEITIYDPPPAPTYTYSSARTCINADFTFTNTTNDGAYVGPLEYLWEFIDEPSGTVVATATTKDAIYAFETEGEKTVRLTSSIPGCSELTEQTLMITPGPTANFTASPVCQNEAMQFTNTSMDATSYSWDFGDGFVSTATNPSHIFSGAGNYFVTLTATDDEGCDDSEIIEVSVSDSPQINFDFDVPCTSADGIQFFDLTTVENADLVSWTWYVDDAEVSTQQSPHIVFESTGIKNVRLDVQSSNGCESSYSEDIEVLTSPEPDFNVSIGCQGETSVFTDNTETSGNPIVSWLWTVEGTNYGTQDITHVFTEAGMFDVTLEVTGQNFCSETITKTIEIIELPSISFSVDGECDNQLIRAQDQSSASADPVISRRWMLDGLNVGSGSQLLLESLANDTYELALELETASGCLISAAQTLEINVAPESFFTSSRTYGIPGDQLSFSNSSTGAVSYQWLLNGTVISTAAQSQNISFTDAGTHIVSLVAQNSLGCNDTTNQEVLIAIPEVDISIGSFEMVRENTTGRIFLEVQNFSNLPIEITEAQIVLENQFTVTEQILKFIDVGESSLVSLNVGIPLNISEPSYFCVKLTSQYVDFPDVNLANNEKCITIKPMIQVEDPFPNPVSDQFRLKVILPEEDVVLLRLLNSAGKIYSEDRFNATQGLNNILVDMSTLDPGFYFVTVDVGGVTFRRKVIKL